MAKLVIGGVAMQRLLMQLFVNIAIGVGCIYYATTLSFTGLAWLGYLLYAIAILSLLNSFRTGSAIAKTMQERRKKQN